MQQPTESQQPEENVTVMICRFAKERDEAALSQMFQNTSVDCTYGRYPATYLLAKEGTEESVQAMDFLCKRYGANVNWAIMGAAAAGNFRLVRKLLKYGAMLNYAMYGAGQRGDRDLVNWLKARGGDVFWAVSGAAGSDNRELYNVLNNEAERINKSRSPGGGDFLLGGSLVDNPVLFHQLMDSGASQTLLVQTILAAAQVSDTKFLANLLNRELERGLATKTDWVIMGAFAGHQDALRKQYMRRDSQVLWAAEGAGYGGHLNLIEFLIRKLPERKQKILNSAANSAALNGHASLVHLLWARGAHACPYPERLDDGFLDRAAAGGNIQILNECHVAVLKYGKEVRPVIIANLEKGGFINGNVDDTLRVASFINDDQLREMFVTAAHEKNKELNPKFLFRKATLLNNFMKKYSLNYNQALAWNRPEIRTLLLPRGLAANVPYDVVKHIASYVVPLTEFEVNELVEKLKHAKESAALTLKFSGSGKTTDEKEPEPPEQEESGPKP